MDAWLKRALWYMLCMHTWQNVKGIDGSKIMWVPCRRSCDVRVNLHASKYSVIEAKQSKASVLLVQVGIERMESWKRR